jgi:hypothetical protein
MDEQLKPFAIFNYPGTLPGAEYMHYVEYRPITNADSAEAIEFHFTTSGTEYCYPKLTKLCVQCKVTKENGDNCGSTDEYVPINLLLQTMWKEVTTTLQGQRLTTASGNYAYQAYLKTILTQSERRGRSLMTQFYAKDIDPFDQVVIPAKAERGAVVQNGGMVLRKAWARESKVIYLQGTLNDPFF